MNHRLLATVGAIALLTVGCDDGIPDLDTPPAAERVREIVRTYGPSSALDDCPFDGVTELLSDSFGLVDEEITRNALLGEPAAAVAPLAEPESPVVVCELITSNASIGFSLTEAPGDFEQFALTVAGAPSDDLAIDVDESRLFRGGRFHRVCVTDHLDPAMSYCEVTWLDDRLLISTFVRGPGADDIDVNDLQERYQYYVPVIVESLKER